MNTKNHRVGVSGHQRLTLATESAVRSALSEYLKALPSPIGLTSLAEGADQIFAEEIIGVHGELEAIIPSDRYEESLQTPTARSNYERLRSVSTRVVQLEYPAPSEDAYWAAGKRIVEDCDELVAIWDGRPAAGHGGTGDVVEYARKIGRPVVVIWPEGARRR